ncbi:MAG: putative peptidoglycan glycosyltransferase FtsW [Eubacteriales bacterium]|nr:putative peptidoglycan glycosyltransferase FtsW [Eubacteriales bacterium]
MKEKRLVSPEKDKGEFTEETKQKGVLIRWIGEVDRPFMFLVIALVCIGSIMVFSASYAYARTWYHDSYYFAKKQIQYVVIGLITMMVISKYIRHRFVLKLTWIGYFIAVALNVAVVLMGFIGNGAQRWINIGPFSVQPSEILKFMTILVCAKYISDNQARIKTFRFGILPFAVIMVPSVILLYFQSHLSAIIITVLLIYFMMFLGGSSMKWLGTIGGAGFASAAFVITNVDTITGWTFVQEKLGHVYNRLLVWKDPFSYMKDVATGDAGWQPSQSLFAISSGGLWGVGLGQSMEKHGYLPEPQNDYIFSILCEEMGFAGAFIVICLFAALIMRGFYIAKNCKDRFCQLVVSGLMVKMGLQVILNIAVVTNTIPSTGISLPFISCGGSALLITLVEMGLVLSISRYSYTMRGDV